MKKDKNGLIGFLIILAFIIVVVGIFFIMYYGRYILFILGVAFLITTIILNQQYEDENKKVKIEKTREKIVPLDLTNEKTYRLSNDTYDDVFTAIYDSNNQLIAQSVQLPDNDFFMLSGYKEGIYFFKTVGLDKKKRWVTINCQVIIYQYAKPIQIVTEEQYKRMK